jgi:hypothetical protein
MRTYVDIYFSASGASPMKVAEALKRDVGLTFVFGEHDLVINWQDVSELFEVIDKLNSVLAPMGVYFRFESHPDQEDAPELREYSWPPILPPS